MAKQDLVVELFYSGVWNEVPAYVRDPVTITRERPAGSEPTPFTATVTLQGFHNPKNPTSELYGLAGQNTPIRFTLDSDVRFYGEVASWAPRRSINYDAAAGTGDAWTEVEATGILRRLGQGADPFQSALYRAVTLDGTALGHWPMEDPERSTQAVNTVSGGASATPVTEVRYTTADGTDIPPGGAPRFGVGLGPAGTDKLVDMTGGGTLEGAVPSGGTGWTVEFVFRFAVNAADGSTSEDIFEWTGTGTYDKFTVNVTQAGLTVFHEIDDSIAGSADAAFTIFDGVAHHFRYTTSQSGGNYLSRLYIDGNLMDTADNFGSPMTGTIGTVDGWVLNPLEEHNEVMPIAFGSVVVWPSDTPPTGLVEAAFGWQGETAGERFERLCDEEGITNTVVGTNTDTQSMGPQYFDTLPKLFAEIERTDDGLLYEPRDSYGLVYRTGRDRYSQTPALTLDYDAHQVAPPLDPVLDDLASRNDVTVQRRDDSTTARAVLETGALSVQDPPDGIGRYTTKIDVNTASVAVLTEHAGWHLHKGTVDGIRYNRVTVDLDASPELATDAAAVDIGDLITIDNLPVNEHPEQARLLVLGYTEVIESHRRKITFLCIPASTFDVGVYGTDPDGIVSRYASDDSTLNTAIDLDDTLLSVAWTLLGWTDADGDFDIHVGGERMTVTAISGSTSPQTFTVIRSVNGVVKSHSSTAPVALADPAYYGL